MLRTINPKLQNYWSPHALTCIPQQEKAPHDKKPMCTSKFIQFSLPCCIYLLSFSWRATSSPHYQFKQDKAQFCFSPSFISPISWQVRWKAREWARELTHLFGINLQGHFLVSLLWRLTNHLPMYPQDALLPTARLSNSSQSALQERY